MTIGWARRRSRLALIVLSLLSVAGFAGSFMLAPYSPLAGGVDGWALLLALWQGGETVEAVIAREIRLPRAVLGVSVGISLGLAGAALQSLLRNRLAEPSLVGASGGAALGAVLALYYGWADQFRLAVPLAGVAGALVAMAVLIMLCRPMSSARRGGIGRIILAGIAIESLAASGVALALSLAPNPFAGLEIGLWLMGSLTDRSSAHLIIALPLMVAGWVLLWRQRICLDALSLGEDTAYSLGTDLGRLQTRVICGIALSVGAAVSIAGSIGFVGLAAPHLVRPWMGSLPSRVIPASMLAGAVLILVGDMVVRRVALQGELRLGIATALLGAPFFLFLIARQRE